MTSNALTSICLLLATLALAPRVHACAMENLEIADAPKAKVGVFTEEGKFDHEVDRALVVHAHVIACNEKLGLVQIAQTDGNKIWIDPIEVKILTPPAANSSKPCVTQNNVKDHDTRMVVSSGAEPERKCNTTGR